MKLKLTAIRENELYRKAIEFFNGKFNTARGAGRTAEQAYQSARTATDEQFGRGWGFSHQLIGQSNPEVVNEINASKSYLAGGDADAAKTVKTFAVITNTGDVFMSVRPALMKKLAALVGLQENQFEALSSIAGTLELTVEAESRHADEDSYTDRNQEEQDYTVDHASIVSITGEMVKEPNFLQQRNLNNILLKIESPEYSFPMMLKRGAAVAAPAGTFNPPAAGGEPLVDTEGFIIDDAGEYILDASGNKQKA